MTRRAAALAAAQLEVGVEPDTQVRGNEAVMGEHLLHLAVQGRPVETGVLLLGVSGEGAPGLGEVCVLRWAEDVGRYEDPSAGVEAALDAPAECLGPGPLRGLVHHEIVQDGDVASLAPELRA